MSRDSCFYYTLVILCFFISTFLLGQWLDREIAPDEHANKVCQHLYGPQTGAAWQNDLMVCETVRGEILPLKRTP